MEYQSLLQLTLELEGLLTLRINRAGDADAANIDVLDDMISAHIAQLSGCCVLPEISEEVEPAEEIAEITPDSAIDEETPAELTPVAPEPSAAPEPSVAPETPAVSEMPAAPDAIGDRQPAESLYDRLARERAANLTKAFSLNDKFRFCRELFRNSQQEMEEAIEALSQMTTADEAAEYIYDDLCLSPDSPDVKDFMDIITKHF